MRLCTSIGNLYKRGAVKMTPEEKIIQAIREGLIEKYSEEFLELSKEEQNNVIADELQKCFERFKNGE